MIRLLRKINMVHRIHSLCDSSILKTVSAIYLAYSELLKNPDGFDYGALNE